MQPESQVYAARLDDPRPRQPYTKPAPFFHQEQRVNIQEAIAAQKREREALTIVYAFMAFLLGALAVVIYYAPQIDAWGRP